MPNPSGAWWWWRWYQLITLTWLFLSISTQILDTSWIWNSFTYLYIYYLFIHLLFIYLFRSIGRGKDFIFQQCRRDTRVRMHVFSVTDGFEFVCDIDMLNIYWEKRYCIHLYWEATLSWMQRNIMLNVSNCPTRWNTKQSIYCSASSLYMFRVSTTPITRRTQNCNYSLRYWSYFCVQLPPSNVAR